NFFDAGLKVGQDFPVLRLPGEVPLNAGPVRPLKDGPPPKKPITFQEVYGKILPLSFTGRPVSGLTWLKDGEHYLQVKGGRLRKVHALTGRSEPFHDPQKLAKGLASLPSLSKGAARAMAQQVVFDMNPQRTGSLFEYENDLYFCKFDGTGAARL